MKKRTPRIFKPTAGTGTPLYLQLARHIGEEVNEGRYEPHEALPSERALSESLGLSRVTTRKAIEQLALQGLIVRRRGSGNYIAPRLEQPLSRLTSFSEELRARGYEPSSRWISRETTTASAEERDALGLANGARVARLRRLRTADDTVMAFEESVLPAALLPDPSQVEGSLYEFLAAQRKTPVRARQYIHALNASAQLARHLRVPTGRAVLYIRRIGYLRSGEPMELTCSYFRSDYYDLVAELRRET